MLADVQLADRLAAAKKELDDALAAIAADVGYDPANGRKFECCDDYLGEPYTSPFNGVVSYDDCRRCAWPHSEHRGAVA